MDIVRIFSRINVCGAPNNFTHHPSAVGQGLLGARQFSKFVALSVNHGPKTVARTLRADSKVCKSHGPHLNPIISQLCSIF